MVLASAVFFLVHFVVGDMEWFAFFRLLGCERGGWSAVFLPLVEFFKVPQLQFIGRVVVISVASQRQGSLCKLCKTGDCVVQFFAKVLTYLCCACRGSAENCGLPAVASIHKVVDVPVVQFVLEFVQFLDKVVDMPIGVRLPWFAESCTKLRSFRSCSSSTSLVHVPVVMLRLVPMVQTVQLGIEAWAAHYCDDELWGPAHRARPGVVSTGTRPP